MIVINPIHTINFIIGLSWIKKKYILFFENHFLYDKVLHITANKIDS